MTKITMPSKEFKSALKMIETFAENNTISRTTIMIHPTGNAKLPIAFTLVNDYVQMQFSPKDTTAEGDLSFICDPEWLAKISPQSKTIELSWKDNTSILITDGKIKSNLKCGVSSKFTGFFPPTKFDAAIPGAVFKKLLDTCKLPGVYHKVVLEQLPMRIYCDQGLLCGTTDDSYSVMKFESDCPIPQNIDLYIPRYVADALLELDFEKDNIQIGQEGFRIHIASSNFSMICTGPDVQIQTMESAIEAQGAVKLSAKFKPDLLAKAVKPLISLMPSKDRSGAYVVTYFEMDKGMSIEIKHSNFDSSVGGIDGISDLYIERGARSLHANMHPAGFLAYTNLLETTDAEMKFYDRAVLYSCTSPVKVGERSYTEKRQYLFPMVEV
jgi:hypothetical protein